MVFFKYALYISKWFKIANKAFFSCEQGREIKNEVKNGL